VGGVPATGVSAVVMNVTVVSPSAPGYVTVWPTGVARPNASNVNFAAGRTSPNLVEVAVGADGKVSMFNGQASGSAHVLFDVTGYVTTPGEASGREGRYNPLTPARIFDTRSSPPKLSLGADRTVQVAGQGGVPPSGVSAVVVNVTLTNVSLPSGGEGWLTVYPSGTSLPTASNLNFVSGQEVANRVVMPLGADGKLSLHLGRSTNDGSSTDVIVDVGGWFTDATNAAGGATYVPITPNRIADTRSSGGAFAPNETRAIQVAGTPGVPTDATAVVLNATVTATSARSWLTVWPAGVSQPGVSDLHWAAGDPRANLVVVKLSPDGQLAVNNALGSTHVILDVQGWYG
jgi:hypothetical protein